MKTAALSLFALLSFAAFACGSDPKKPAMVADNGAGDGGEEPSKDSDGDGGAGSASSSSSEADGGGGGGDKANAAAISQGTEEGAQALLKQFVAKDADHGALTKSLKPTTADYKALFDTASAAKVEAAQAKDWDSGKAVIKPKPNQTEVKLWSASGADIAAGKGNAKEFPGGYKKIAKHLAQQVLFYRFKFVEAGKDTGVAYDGLAFVNGHWVIAPKPWKALEASGKDEDDASDTPATKPKPKGKPRKK